MKDDDDDGDGDDDESLASLYIIPTNNNKSLIGFTPFCFMEFGNNEWDFYSELTNISVVILGCKLHGFPVN